MEKRYSEEQIIGALKRQEAGTTITAGYAHGAVIRTETRGSTWRANLNDTRVPLSLVTRMHATYSDRMQRPTGYEPLFTLKPVVDDVWVADGGWIKFYGIPFPTRMTVIRLANGSIWVHSPIADQNGLADAVTDLGPVRHLIAPNWIHYGWLPDWQSRFPEATTWGSPGVVDRAAGRGVNLAIDTVLADIAPPDWSDQIDQRLADSGYHRELVFFHRVSRTLILTDLIENFEPKNMPWWALPLLKLGRVCHPDGRMPRDMAASFRLKGRHLSKLVETMIAWGPERVILAHGRWYEGDGTAELRRAFRGVL